MASTQGGKVTKEILALCLCSFAPLFLSTTPAPALELSLEENRGQSGTVGFVDIDRVFKEYSGTLEAREEFLGEIKKKEESVNQRKRVVYSLKADIAKLRQERAFALTLPSLLATEEQLNRAEARPQPPAAAVTTSSVAAVTISSAAAVATSSAAAVATSSSAAAAGFAETPAAALAPDAVIASTDAAAKPPAGPAAGSINMPGMGGVPISYFKFSVSTAVPEIDAAIAAKETELKQKEDALKLYQRQAEKELLEYESHRSEMLLGRAYYMLKELAVSAGVSVIVDKRSILFGHSAVDLTDKLLAALEAER
jgi:Skp family chaperone for outer membrane proteins